MKIIIFSILFTVQAQYIDDELISNEISTLTNDVDLITRTENDRTNFMEASNDHFSNRIDFDGINATTVPSDPFSSNITDDGQTWSALVTHDQWSFSSFISTNDLDFMTSSEGTNVIVQDSWFNVNQSQRRNPTASVLFWKSVNDPSSGGTTYTLTSDPRCLRQACSVILKHNGTLATDIGGCLSFALRIRGQPVGQLWIVEDKEQDNALQKIQLTNKTLRIEHSLRSKIKNLSIATRILFRNPQIDALYLSNLKVNWKGPCPKTRRVPTPSPDINRRATLEDEFMTLTSEGSGSMYTLTTNEDYQNNDEQFKYDPTTVSSKTKSTTKRPFAFTNQKNLGWVLTSITLACVFLLLAAVGHGLWLLRRQRHFSWYFAFDSQIQLLARRSIRSSTRSEKKIATISEIANDILNTESQREQTYSPSTSSFESASPISYYTYL
ncbi:unnamed protein product [Adineta ricciae]|uniref:Uncharacterized protein n=1 Tax=Adineta ricciae TaxID=249248 RepID=A0A814Q4X0_ADIRI|nr:unnamed protein product [Adineta ricciae]CAF1603477.1 unnamed protein product [Adineta ricciae]